MPEKKAAEEKLDWKSMINGAKKGQDGKPKTKGILGNMKKKIIKTNASKLDKIEQKGG